AFADRWINRHQHGADTREVVAELRHQHQRPLEPRARFFQLTLREINTTEVIPHLRVVRREREYLFVQPNSFVQLSLMLMPDCLAEQTAGRRFHRQRPAGLRRRHGAALLSIHPNSLLAALSPSYPLALPPSSQRPPAPACPL